MEPRRVVWVGWGYGSLCVEGQGRAKRKWFCWSCSIQRGFQGLRCIIIRKARIMCFIKKVELGVEPIIYPCEHQCYCYNIQYVSSNPSPSLFNGHFNIPDQFSLPLQPLLAQMTTDLASLLHTINSNNAKIFSSLESLSQNEGLIEQARLQVEQKLSKSEGSSSCSVNLQPHCELNEIPFFSNQAIISKIFGPKQYKYKLTLAQQFPKIIYKERNLNIAVKLTNPNTQALCNANLIHLCIGVCNNLGQWIVQESGDFFMQGKIEIDLYHGEAEFKKISPKDVSRHFNGGVVNLVIYPKKSLINFTGEVSKYEKEIDSDFIEPLVIRDIVIKAKKKCKN